MFVWSINRSEQAVTATSLAPDSQRSATNQTRIYNYGHSPTYGSNDVRKLNNLDQLFDGVYNNFVEFSDYAHKDGRNLETWWRTYHQED